MQQLKNFLIPIVLHARVGDALSAHVEPALQFGKVWTKFWVLLEVHELRSLIVKCDAT